MGEITLNRHTKQWDEKLFAAEETHSVEKLWNKIKKKKRLISDFSVPQLFALLSSVNIADISEQALLSEYINRYRDRLSQSQLLDVIIAFAYRFNMTALPRDQVDQLNSFFGAQIDPQDPYKQQKIEKQIRTLKEKLAVVFSPIYLEELLRSYPELVQSLSLKTLFFLAEQDEGLESYFLNTEEIRSILQRDPYEYYRMYLRHPMSLQMAHEVLMVPTLVDYKRALETKFNEGKKSQENREIDEVQSKEQLTLLYDEISLLRLRKKNLSDKRKKYLADKENLLVQLNVLERQTNQNDSSRKNVLERLEAVEESIQKLTDEIANITLQLDCKLSALMRMSHTTRSVASPEQSEREQAPLDLLRFITPDSEHFETSLKGCRKNVQELIRLSPHYVTLLQEQHIDAMLQLCEKDEDVDELYHYLKKNNKLGLISQQSMVTVLPALSNTLGKKEFKKLLNRKYKNEEGKSERLIGTLKRALTAPSKTSVGIHLNSTLICRLLENNRIRGRLHLASILSPMIQGYFDPLSENVDASEQETREREKISVQRKLDAQRLRNIIANDDYLFEVFRKEDCTQSQHFESDYCEARKFFTTAYATYQTQQKEKTKEEKKAKETNKTKNKEKKRFGFKEKVRQIIFSKEYKKKDLQSFMNNWIKNPDNKSQILYAYLTKHPKFKPLLIGYNSGLYQKGYYQEFHDERIARKSPYLLLLLKRDQQGLPYYRHLAALAIDESERAYLRRFLTVSNRVSKDAEERIGDSEFLFQNILQSIQQEVPKVEQAYYYQKLCDLYGDLENCRPYFAVLGYEFKGNEFKDEQAEQIESANRLSNERASVAEKQLVPIKPNKVEEAAEKEPKEIGKNSSSIYRLLSQADSIEFRMSQREASVHASMVVSHIQNPLKRLIDEIQQVFLFEVSSEDPAARFQIMTPLILSQELQKAMKVRLHYYQLRSELSITDRASADHYYHDFFNRVCDYCEAWVAEGLSEHLKQSRSEKDIKTLIRNLSLWLHPDKNEGEQEKKRAEGLFKTLLERIKEQLNKKAKGSITQEQRDILEKFKETVLEMFRKHYGEVKAEWLNYYESYEKEQDRIIAAHQAHLKQLKADNKELNEIGVKLREQEKERIAINREIAETREETAKVRAETAKVSELTAKVRKVTAKVEETTAETRAETASLKEQFNQMQRMMMSMMQRTNPQMLLIMQQWMNAGADTTRSDLSENIDVSNRELRK